MTSCRILRKGSLLSGCIQHASCPAVFQKPTLRLHHQVYLLSSNRVSPQPVSLLPIRDPELTSIMQMRTLHLSRSVQEAAERPAETSMASKASGDGVALGSTSGSAANNLSSSFRQKSSKNLGKSVRPFPIQEGKFSFLSVQSLFSTPYPFMVYGLGGLIPFAAAPWYMQYTGLYHPGIAHAQLVYGATILSFLGGVSWGENLPHSKASLESLGYSISLPLVGWLSVLMHPSSISFLALMSGIGVAGFVDTQNKNYPKWFRNLRFLLSSVVLLCLFSTLVFGFTKNSSNSVDTQLQSE